MSGYLATLVCPTFAVRFMQSIEVRNGALAPARGALELERSRLPAVYVDD